MRCAASPAPCPVSATHNWRCVNPEAAHGCIGFDPVSFAVDDHADVQAWAAHLDTLGVAHSPVIEASVGWLLVIDNPDGISLHL